MNTAPKLFSSAYPGSMHQREDGDYVERNDDASLAAALLANIRAARNMIEDLEAVEAERDRLKAINAELLAACRAVVSHGDEYEAIVKCRAAIARSTREES